MLHCENQKMERSRTLVEQMLVKRVSIFTARYLQVIYLNTEILLMNININLRLEIIFYMNL